MAILCVNFTELEDTQIFGIIFECTNGIFLEETGISINRQ